MCGIAGFMLTDRAAPPGAVLDTLERALSHRGPDGVKRHVEEGLGLVHTRLAIIDLETGDQPLYGPNGTVLIVCNGEIYNYIELEAEFPGANFQPPTRIASCRSGSTIATERGDFAKSLRGMYAHRALRSPAEATLFLARDPFGIKPLYYAETARAARFRLRAASDSERPVSSRRAIAHRSDRDRAAAAAIHHRARDDLRRHPAGARAGENAVVRRGQRRRTPPHRRRLPKATAARVTEDDALDASSAPDGQRRSCISAPTCPTACSCPAVSIRPRCSPAWRS